MICAGCRAANYDESLDAAKARCIGECKEWLGYRFEAPMDAGGLILGEDVEISINIEAAKK